ncbi:ribonuclease H-like domain-containing protein [Tanacetum coccineum]
MTNTQTPPTVVNTTGAPVTNTVANHGEKPEKFNGQNFKRWQQKMFFYLTTLGLARFLKETAPQVEPPVEGQSSNAQAVQTVEAWKHSDFLCHNYVLNGLIDPLYNVYCKTTTAKELWEPLERKYKTEDAGTKKFVVAHCNTPKIRSQRKGHRAANCKMPKRVNPRQANIVNDNMDMVAMVSDVIATVSEVNLVLSVNVMVVKNDINKMNSSTYLIESSNVWHGEDEFHDDNTPPPPPPPVTPTQQAPHTLSTIKLHILKKGEYDIWAMKMEHYLGHTDYPIWEVIQKGNGPVQVSTDTNGQIRVLPPKTAEEILARERERKARTTLLMSIPEDHLAKFHKMTNAKEMWEAIKSRFGGNDESKKMQKYILKQQFESFSVSNSEGLHKGYDRFQSLLSQLEIHGAGVSTEDANQKFLRSLPASWSQVSLIMRTKPGVDTLSFDDLYNNLRVFESDTLLHHLPAHRMWCLFLLKALTLKYSFFANQSSGPQLDHEDLEQVNEFDLKEMDLKWQVAMISMRLKKFYKKTWRRLQFDAKEPVGFDKTKIECYNCHKTGHFARECRSKGNQDSRRRDAWNIGNKDKDNRRRSGKHEESKALVTLDGEGVDWTSHSEDEQENYALMAYSSSGSDTEMSARDKTGLGYGDQMNKGVLSYENEVFQSVFVSRTSDIEDSPVNDRYAEEMHAVPPLMTGIYIPSRPDKEIDDSQLRYGSKANLNLDEIYNARSSDFNSCESNSSEETHESMPEPVVNEPKVVSQPKVWSDAPIIKEYELDSDDEHMSVPSKEKETTSFAFINTVKHVKTPRQTVKEQNTCNQKVNTAEVKAVSVVGGKRETAFIPSARCKLETANRLYWKKWDVTTHMTKKQGLLAELTNLMVAPVALEMCDKKNKVLFTNTECLVLSPEFKLPDENQDELERLERQEKDVNDAAEALRKEFAQDIEDLLL